MKETTTLEMSGSGKLIPSLLLFIGIFSLFVLVSFVIRILSLGFYKISFNKKFLRKYIHYSNVLISRNL